MKSRLERRLYYADKMQEILQAARDEGICIRGSTDAGSNTVTTCDLPEDFIGAEIVKDA